MPVWSPADNDTRGWMHGPRLLITHKGQQEEYSTLCGPLLLKNKHQMKFYYITGPAVCNGISFNKLPVITHESHMPPQLRQWKQCQWVKSISCVAKSGQRILYT